MGGGGGGGGPAGTERPRLNSHVCTHLAANVWKFGEHFTVGSVSQLLAFESGQQ